MTKYFVDKDGNYKGGYEGVEPSKDFVEVPSPPPYGLDKWDGNAWIPYAIPDLESFVLGVLLDPDFSDREVMQVQAVSRINDVVKRDKLIVQLVLAAPKKKQTKLLGLAAQYNIPLPKLE